MGKHKQQLENNKLISEHCSELAELIESLTHSGLKTLEKDKLKKVKSICKSSEKNVEQVYHLIVHQLEKNHSEVRFSAFQLCDEIFRRSHCFRQLVINNLSHILELTVETNPERPLPLPRTAALNLKKLALVTVSEWCDQYGPSYKRLILGCNYLKKCKKVDFSAIHLQSSAERARQEEKERRLQAINKERVKKVEIELNDFSLDISTSVKSLISGLDILLPKPEEFFILEKDEIKETKEPLVDNVKALNEFSDVKTEDSFTKKEMPDFGNNSDKVIEELDNYDEMAGNSMLREFGALNHKHSVEIQLNLDDINYLKETPENEVIVNSIRDQVKLISNNYLPRVKGWLQILAVSSGSAVLTKKIVDIKISMESAIKKYRRLNIKPLVEDDCVSTDSELEEVDSSERENLKFRANKSKINETIKKVDDKSEWSIISKEEKSDDPTTVQARLLSYEKHKSEVKKKANITTRKSGINDEPKPSTSKEIDNAVPSTSKMTDNEILSCRKNKLLAVAPKLPFDIDLYHWEDEKLEAPTLLPTLIDSNKFWSTTSGDDFMEVAVPEGTSLFRTRVIEFAGEFEPVTKSCRAPLPSGKLCPRKDRFKCPFHGVIVPRDVTGNCVNSEDEERLKAVEEKTKVPDWQDPELLKDIEKATGIDLKMPEKRGKGKKRKKEKKYPGLTDIKAKQNTARNRLSKKLFNRASVKRIANTLDSIDHRRFRDKYGDQFNYMHNTS